MKIYYKKGYKYKLEEDFKIQLGFKPQLTIFIEHPFMIFEDGFLTIKKGYSWDGASCAIDTKTFMRGALVHDVLYQLIREGFLLKEDRKACDKELIRICSLDGMCGLRRAYVYRAVRIFGKWAVKPRKVYIRP